MKRITAALIAFSFLVAPVAQAQQYNAPKPSHQSQMQKPGQASKPSQAQRPGQSSKPSQAQRPGHSGKPGQQVGNRPGYQYAKPSQKRPSQWKRGNRYGDWRRHQPVRDYHRYGLHRPGPGQQWIRVGNEYLLIGITTGIIAGLIAASR